MSDAVARQIAGIILKTILMDVSVSLLGSVDRPSDCSYYLIVDVTFDPEKDAENIRKHGISLQRAEDFDFDAAIFDIDDSQDYGEVRWNAVGFLDARLFSLTFTEMEAGVIRAISLRKAATEESNRYEQRY